MKGGGGSSGGPITTSYRDCECGISAVFYTVQKDFVLTMGADHKDALEIEEKTRSKLLSIFMLADLEVLNHWDIKNEYRGDKADWLLVETKLGMIKIGWIHRVINIDWKATGIKMTVSDDVTKNEYHCHAWSYVKAIEYITQLTTIKA
jgi:hypothetical protein